jgi:hypothetical protein
MKTPRTLQEYFETQTVDQKAAFTVLRMAVLSVKEQELRDKKKKNPFEK